MGNPMCKRRRQKILGIWAYSDDRTNIVGVNTKTWTWDNITNFINSLWYEDCISRWNKSLQSWRRFIWMCNDAYNVKSVLSRHSDGSVNFDCKLLVANSSKDSIDRGNLKMLLRNYSQLKRKLHYFILPDMVI